MDRVPVTSERPHEPLDALAAWRGWPAPEPVPETPWLSRRQRIGLMAGVLAGHALLVWMLDLGTRIRIDPPPPRETTLVFLEPPPAPAPPTEPEPRPEPEPAPPTSTERPARPAPTPPRASASSPAPTPTRRRPRETAMQVVEAPKAEPLQLFRADGSVDLPEEVKDQLEDVLADDRAFAFQYPNLMEAGTFMERQPALVYEATQFDQYWRPNQDILTEFLERAVEATTQTIEIPVPGDPGAKIVCQVSVLAMGGGCGIVRNDFGYVVGLDDPETLSPEEAKQCEAWWDQIVAASGQEAWRRTRELYERSCRKPLEKTRPRPD